MNDSTEGGSNNHSSSSSNDTLLGESHNKNNYGSYNDV